MSDKDTPPNPQADIAKAFQELAEGEQTASALEAQLNSLESKIEELLAKAEEDQKAMTTNGHPESSKTEDQH